MDIRNEDNFIIGTGLNPTIRDSRDFSLGGYFGRLELPKKPFIVAKSKVKDQGKSDMCTAFAVCTVSEAQEGISLSPNYQFAKTKQLLGNASGWGADLRTAAKSAKVFGSIPESSDPYLNSSRNFVANWRNWPSSYDTEAREHKKKSYFWADSYNTLFDSILSALWRFRDEKRLLMTGTLWRQSWTLKRDGVILDAKYIKRGFGHAFALIGLEYFKNEPYIVAQLSNGRGYGNDGYFYFPRGVVNREFTKYGAIMFQDLSAEEVKKVHWNRWQRWIDKFKKLF